MKPTTDAVWKALMNDWDFVTLPDSVKLAIRPIIDKIPDVLENLLEKPANFETMVQARLRVMDLFYDDDYAYFFSDAMPDDFLRDEIHHAQRDRIETTRAILYSISLFPSDFLTRIGSTDREVMLSRSMGLVGEARELYLYGKLTVGELLTIQPRTIIEEYK
ncbi:hypothetical protein KBC70_00165 [Candidatus Woesebacteria bacterium]|nr:hypothetical protein [Candidatus Woesebacteria bacterium]